MASILLVDDSESIRVLLHKTLVGAGHRVAMAHNGKQGIALMSGDHFDVLVTDIYMPDADGMEVLTAWRRLKKGPHVIAMSSKTGPMNILRNARMLGAKITLQKPFPPTELLAAVEVLLRTQGGNLGQHPLAQ